MISPNTHSHGSVAILIPVGETASRQLITQALHVLSSFRDPLVVLFNVVEVPSRTGTLDPEPYREEIMKAQERLNEVSEWLSAQGLRTKVKVAIARNVVEGIIEETNSGDYLLIFLMKRKITKRWKRFLARSVSEQVVREASCLVLTAPLRTA